MAKVHGILEAGPLPALPFMRACDVCPFTLLHASSHASGRPPGPRVRPSDPKHPLEHSQACFVVAVHTVSLSCSTTVTQSLRCSA